MPNIFDPEKEFGDLIKPIADAKETTKYIGIVTAVVVVVGGYFLLKR